MHEDQSVQDMIRQAQRETQEEVIEELVKKLKDFCTQNKPSSRSILEVLHDLKVKTGNIKHKDAGLYNELHRQAETNEDELDIAELVLHTMSSAADKVFNAVIKCKKSKRSSTDTKTTKIDQAPTPSSPRQSDFQRGSFMPGPSFFNPFLAQGYQQGYGSYGNNMGAYNINRGRGYRGGFRGRYTGGYGGPSANNTNTSNGNCHLCEEAGHFVINCPKLSAAKRNII